MKKLVFAFAVLALVVATLELHSVFGGNSLAAESPRRALNHGPALGVDQPQQLKFAVDDETVGNQTDRELRDQMRDWLLLTALAQCADTTEELSRCTYDLPVIRHGYVRPVSLLEYTDSRSRAMESGQVVAVIPAGLGAAARNDALARIVDEQTKNLGEIPSTVQVFEYELDEVTGLATLTRRASVVGKDLFRPETGHVEVIVRSRADLESFLRRVDLLTGARREGGGLVLQGRKHGASAWRGASMEHVASLWRAESQLRKRVAAFESKWEQKQRDLQMRARYEQTGRKTRVSDRPGQIESFEEIMRRLRDPQSALPPQFRALVKVPEFDVDAEVEQLRREYAEEHQRLKIRDGTGFSLDPSYDFDSLKAALERGSWKILANLLSPASAAPDLPTRVREALEIKSLQPDLPTHVLEALGNKSLQPDKRIEPLFVYMQSNQAERSYVVEALRSVLRGSQFQAARYDGDLQGTEVGMILFYTDLLAKLWALDFKNNRLGEHVPDFHSMTESSIAAIYAKEERELSATRLWFGPEDNGFQISEDKQTLHFAHVATRIYAASHNEFSPGKEVAPNASSEAFLGWWNDHYEEVAEYEQEYRRLDEVMKWSLLMTWLFDCQASGLLEFLDVSLLDVSSGVTVRADLWFPDWVKQQKDLRFTHWDAIEFFPKNAKNTTTEALPMLTSKPYQQFGEIMHLSGGVSLARKGLFLERPALTKVVSPGFRRSGLDYAHTSESALTTLRGTSYSLERSAGVSRVGSKAAEGTHFRARSMEMAKCTFKREATVEGNTIRMRAWGGDNSIGELTIAREGTGFRVAWRAREVDRGHALVRRLSSAEDPAALLRGDGAVEAAFEVDGQYVVKMQGADRWLVLAEEKVPTSAIPAGFHARVADFTPRSRNYNLRWVSDADARRTVNGKAALKDQLIDGRVRAIHDAEYAKVGPELAKSPADAAAAIAGRRKALLADAERRMRSGHTDGMREILDVLERDFGGAGPLREQFECLRRYQDCIAKGTGRDAVKAIDDLLARGDLDPEMVAGLRMRRGFAMTLGDEPAAAAKYLSDLPETTFQAKDGIVAELAKYSRRYSAKNPTAQDVLAWMDARGLQVGKRPGESMTLALEKGKLAYKHAVTGVKRVPGEVGDDLVKGLRAGDFEELPVYVEGSFNDVLASDAVDVRVLLDRPDVLHYRPTTLQVEHRVFERTASRGTTSGGGYRPYGLRSSNGNGGPSQNPNGPEANNQEAFAASRSSSSPELAGVEDAEELRFRRCVVLLSRAERK